MKSGVSKTNAAFSLPCGKLFRCSADNLVVFTSFTENSGDILMALKVGNSQSSNLTAAEITENTEREKLLANSAAENEAAINFLANNNPPININSSNAAPGDKKTVSDFLRKVKAEQPFDNDVLSKKEVRIFIDVKKPVNQTTVSDYDNATWRAIFQKAGYGMLTDEEIALAVGGMNAVGWTVKDSGFDLSSLRGADAKPGAMVVKTNQAVIERAKRAGQAVLQYQQDKSKEADLQKKLAASRTNQMLLDPLRLGGNTPVRWAERNLNIPRDLMQQLDKGEILPFSSTAKSIGQTIGEKITGQPAPKILTASESIAQLTGVELPSIPEIKLERPFEYQTAKYQNDGKTGEDLGATAIDLILLRRGMMKSQINSPQSLNDLGGLSKVSIATKSSDNLQSAKILNSGKVAEITNTSQTQTVYSTKDMLRKYVGEETGSVWGTKVKYLNDFERSKLELTVKNGNIFDNSGKLFDTSSASSVFGTGQGKAIFVMDEQGKIYASTYQAVGKFHHSSILGGKPVAAAGEITVKNGRIVEISNRSGHYQPSPKVNSQIIKELENKGVDVSNIKITDF